MPDAADTVFIGGHAVLPGSAGAVRAGVAVRSGRIVAVAADDELAGLTGSGTQIVDLAGGLLLPGFQDAHVHPVMAGMDDAAVRPPRHLLRGGGASRSSRRTPRANPDLEWIVGGGWSIEFFEGGTPTREALDEVVPDHPVFLTNRDGHGHWVNYARSSWPGSTPATPDPVDGRIERDADGRPTGTLHEGAGDLVSTAAAARQRGRPPRGAADRPGPAVLARASPAGRTRRSARCSATPTSSRPT